MQKVNNEYAFDGDLAYMKIISSKYASTTVIFDTKFYNDVRKFTWCYELSKGQAYTMDMHMTTAKNIFLYATPRIYLWRYISWLHTGDIRATWNRKNKLDYRTCYGSIIKSLTPVNTPV